MWIKPDPSEPVRQKARILSGGYVLSGPATIRQVLTWLLSGSRQVVINRLSGLLGKFKSNRPLSFSLAHRRPFDVIAVGSNVIGSNGDKVATSQFAIDGKIEERKLAHLSLDLEHSSYRQTCFCLSGGLGPTSFPLFQGTRLGSVLVACSFSCIGRTPRY